MGFLQPNYNKEGPGVRKDAPQKKDFALFFEILARKFWNLVIANFLFVVTALPVVTIGLAEAGITRITRSFSREKFAFIQQDFIESIRKNWKQALPIGIINLLISLLLVWDIYFFYAGGDGITNVLLLAVILVITLVFIFMRYYIPLLLITFKLSVRQIYKDAFLLAMAGMKRNLLISLVLAILYALAGFLCWLNLMIGLTVMLLVYLFIFPAFRSFLIQFTVFPVVKKHIIDPYYRDHPDEDKEKRRDLNLEVDEPAGEDDEPVFEDTPPAPESKKSDFVFPTPHTPSVRVSHDDDDDTI